MNRKNILFAVLFSMLSSVTFCGINEMNSLKNELNDLKSELDRRKIEKEKTVPFFQDGSILQYVCFKIKDREETMFGYFYKDGEDLYFQKAFEDEPYNVSHLAILYPNLIVMYTNANHVLPINSLFSYEATESEILETTFQYHFEISQGLSGFEAYVKNGDKVVEEICHLVFHLSDSTNSNKVLVDTFLFDEYVEKHSQSF